jgi:hypothetical protein
MPRTLFSLSLGGAVVLAGAFACGPQADGTTPPKSPTGSPSGTPSSSSSVTSPATSASASAPPNATATKPPGPSAPPKPVSATAMEAELREIGLDPKALPVLNKLSPDQLRKVMKTFTRALGVQCNACHNTQDFHAPTPNKKIATHMWNDFSRSLAMSDDKPIYCDSCHGGREHFLDRKDLQAVAAFMQENYADKLKRVDKKDHGCETCHGDPIEPKIFTKLWK